MASAITVNCPECDKPLKVPAEARGKKIRCKGCEHVFVIPGGVTKAPAKPAGKGAKPAPPPPPKPVDDDEDEGDGKPNGVTTLDLAARCPTCANEMEEGARICLNCGYDTTTRTYHRTRKTHDQTGGDVFLWLLPGILCAIAVLALIGIDIWWILCMKELVGYPDGEWYDFIGGQACTMWWCIGSLFQMFFAGRFAFNRLVLNNTPPEIEKN